ncbi:hypothetical protein AAFC00_000071 [Neodothiora populina]|uniref:Elongator complex protein 2 n=1 Tax=Neodothiora populina TaxID=2781224 RepID=A0ABR3P1J1_9PEZI
MNKTLDFIAAGGNRHPSAADWNSDVLAFGTGNNIAIWNPHDPQAHGINSLLSGHTDIVNVVKLYRDPKLQRQVLLSGSADKTIRLWIRDTDTGSFTATQTLTEHTASVNAIAVLPDAGLLITGAADATLKIWRLEPLTAESGPHIEVKLIQSISLTPRFFPLALAITRLSDAQIVFAVAGTTSSLRVFVQKGDLFAHGAILTGHEGWIRSLDFVQESSAEDSDILLASASQDKYIRLWRFHKGSELPATASAANDPTLGALGKSLSNKAHYIGEDNSTHSITFEALLIGHEDWIYTARWCGEGQASSGPRLLTASADNSLAIWEQETESGIWACTARLGEISSQKGSTTATGSTGGFWVGLWSPEGSAIVSLGRTGSWRVWSYHSSEDRWLQQIGITGHVREVKDIAWSRDGAYLMSTGSDQTTRLYSEWKRSGVTTWYEMSRPQIHGYDLNCLDSIKSTQFISGADEKLLRVFNKPGAVAKLMSKLGGTEDTSASDLPEAANIPVLGLSNKAVATATSEEEAAEELATNGQSSNDRDAVDPVAITHKSTLDLDHPPFEDHLARHTLWPEHEKLYGHGYEISAVAASHDGSLVATACRASSIDHAVIRLYDTKTWHEVKPTLAAHNLTVTSITFSPDDNYLLSTGRDRQWALFKREEANSTVYKLRVSNPKGHSRMILNCSWAPQAAGSVFATAGRDKSVKIWQVQTESTVECKVTIPTTAAATALAFVPDLVSGNMVLAYGTEDGTVSISAISGNDWAVVETTNIDKNDTPSASVNALRWRPNVDGDDKPGQRQFAIASEDHSLRLFTFAALPGQNLG